MNFRKILLVSILLIPSAFSYAENQLNPIVVGASVAPTDIHSSPASVDILTAVDIKNKGYRNVADLLNSLSSINISTNGGFGQLTSVFTRGTESNHTKFILDGVELNPGTIAMAAIQNIPVHTIEKIEIIKGTSSSLHGSNTIGGIVNIITKKNNNGIIVSAGSWSTSNSTLLKSFNHDDLDIQLNISRMESKSFPAKTSSTKRHGYNSNDISLDIGKTILDYTLTTKIFSSTGNTQYDNFGSNADQDHDDYFYTINLKKSIGQDELNIGYTKSQNKILQNVTNYLGFIDFTKTLRDKYEISYTKIDKRFLNKFGLNYTKEHMSEKSFSQRYTIDPIVRELFYQGDYISSSNIVNYGLRQIHHSQFGSFTAGNFGLSLINNDDVYSFNINRAFRSPDGTDNYGYKGNPNLLPEESLSYEVSMKRFLNKNFMVRGSIFVTDIKNLITVDGAQVQNIDESEITGYEINAQYDDNLFEYNFSYTYMNPKDKTNNEVLAKRSKHKLNTGVTYKLSNKSSMNLNIVGEGEKNASYFSTTMLGSYYIANLNYNVDISNSSLNLSLKNLFDKEYRNSDGYNTADRSFFVTYSLNY